MLRYTRRVVLPLFTAIALLVPLPSTALEPVTLDDVITLVHAGVGQEVIERQVVRTGSTFELGVEEILRLREAGADDALIAFLQERTPAPVSTKATASRSVISASEKAEAEAAGRAHEAEGEAPPTAGPSSAPALAFPSSVEITVRHEGEGTEGRIAELEERLGEIESGGEREVGEGWYPRHPINDDTEYPVYTYPGWWGGYGIGYPVIQPVPFRTIPSGPFLSFTGAAHAGFDPFRPVGPCVPGQACSVAQRVVHPYPPVK
jgi:hypothetical protein